MCLRKSPAALQDLGVSSIIGIDVRHNAYHKRGFTLKYNTIISAPVCEQAQPLHCAGARRRCDADRPSENTGAAKNCCCPVWMCGWKFAITRTAKPNMIWWQRTSPAWVVNIDSQAPNKAVQEWLQTEGYDLRGWRYLRRLPH